MMIFLMTVLIWSSVAASAAVAAMFLSNLFFFRKAGFGIPAMNQSDQAQSGTALMTGESPILHAVSTQNDEIPSVSVLIPARNEALRIGPLLDSVLASEGVRCDICVLDDESQDGTDAIVEVFSKRSPDVRLLKGSPVPAGWSGKQYACHQLAEQAKYEELVFLDADVTLTRDALRRAVMQRRAAQVDLLSGFPRQQVVSIGEQLLIPLIHLILLCFLPFGLMRWTRMVGASAGCGQFFLTTRQAYRLSGGHRSIRQSLHDGILLPRTYRASGLRTDLFDASDLARCRMYSSFPETWQGLLKNAGEGFAKMPILPVMTALMTSAFVFPALFLASILFGFIRTEFFLPVIAACLLGYLPRVICCLKFDRAWLSCGLFPVSIILFLIIQWVALIRKLRGRGVQWRERSYEMATS
jgi:glycosyltransferase involved in cell wall biosynthesis